MQDELAETSVPDPGYAGTNWELDYSWYDLDLFGYWDDLEYGDDTYWDSLGSFATGKKRKRPEGVHKVSPKRKRLSLREMSGGPVAFVSMADRKRQWSRCAPIKKGLKSFALLPDWRERCAEADVSMSVKAMPAEMRRAAEANDEDTPEGPRNHDPDAMDDGEGDWEDEDEDEELQAGDADAAGDALAQIANVDMEALQNVLKQKLGESGLGGVDESMFMQAMQRMLSGSGSTGDVAGELAKHLLDTTAEQDDSAFGSWLSQQGVSLDQADEDDTESVATAEMPGSSSASKQGDGVQISPPDSAIEMVRSGRTAQLALHDGSPKAAKKRLAQTAVEDGGSGRKRKRVTFDVPSSQGGEAALVAADKGDAEGNASSEYPPTTELLTDHSNEPATTGDTVRTERPTTAKPTGAANEVAKSSAASGSSIESKSTKSKAEQVVEAPGPARSTRKRKAEADQEPPPPKKQTRKAANAGRSGGGGGDGQPSYARATRSTKARSGK